MIRYILRILGVLLVAVFVLLWIIGEFICGDIRESCSTLETELRAIKEGFIDAFHGRSIL